MEVNELKSHFHVKWENYKTTLGDAVNSGCHKDEIDDVISDNLEKQTTHLYEYCNSEQVRKCSDGDHMFDYDGKYVNHVGLQYNTTCKICGKTYISEALCNNHSEKYHGSKPEPPAEADDNKHEQRAMIPYRIREKAVEITPGGELDKNRSFALLHGTCDEREKD